MVHSGALYIFERRRGSSNVAGSEIAYPHTPPFRRAWLYREYSMTPAVRRYGL